MFVKRSKALLGSRQPVVMGKVSPRLSVPSGIRLPPYHNKPPPDMDTISIQPRRGKALQAMRDACAKAATALEFAGSLVAVGRTTDEIDRRVHEFITERLNCYPSPLGYSGFPKSICTSINEVLCHGIPDDRPLVKGDIVNVDVSVYTADGVHGDCSEMYVADRDEAGNVLPNAVDARAKRLIDVTRGAVAAAIAVCGPNVAWSTIGDVITQYVEQNSSFSVVDAFTGHGIGCDFHMLPYIVHAPNLYPGHMEVGHTFTIEPVVVEGRTEFSLLADQWTTVSDDLGRGAQMEHTVLITANGAEILSIAN